MREEITKGALAGTAIALALVGMAVWLWFLVAWVEEGQWLHLAALVVVTGAGMGAAASYLDYTERRDRRSY